MNFTEIAKELGSDADTLLNLAEANASAGRKPQAVVAATRARELAQQLGSPQLVEHIDRYPRLRPCPRTTGCGSRTACRRTRSRRVCLREVHAQSRQHRTGDAPLPVAQQAVGTPHRSGAVDRAGSGERARVDDDVRGSNRAEDRVDDTRAVRHSPDRDPRFVLGQGGAGDGRSQP